MLRFDDKEERLEKLVGSTFRFYGLILWHVIAMMIMIYLCPDPYSSSLAFFTIFMGPSYYAWLLYSFSDKENS